MFTTTGAPRPAGNRPIAAHAGSQPPASRELGGDHAGSSTVGGVELDVCDAISGGRASFNSVSAGGGVKLGGRSPVPAHPTQSAGRRAAGPPRRRSARSRAPKVRGQVAVGNDRYPQIQDKGAWP